MSGIFGLSYAVIDDHTPWLAQHTHERRDRVGRQKSPDDVLFEAQTAGGAQDKWQQ